jgi:hypothetical protein
MSAFHNTPTYAAALAECKKNPAYFVRLPLGGLEPCVCYPLMDNDTKGWQLVKRKTRTKKIWTLNELEENANLDNWEDVQHYGGATYTHIDMSRSNYEHNGSLFDIGSRF